MISCAGSEQNKSHRSGQILPATAVELADVMDFTRQHELDHTPGRESSSVASSSRVTGGFGRKSSPKQ